MISRRQHMIVSFLFLLCCSACRKEYSYEGGGTPDNPGNGGSQPLAGAWQFTENNELFTGPTDTAYIESSDNKQTLVISGGNTNATGNIRIILKAPDSTIRKNETYQTVAFSAHFTYFQNNDTLYSAIPYQGGNLSVTITSMDSTHVSGIFSGLVNTGTRGQQKITAGSFTAPLKYNALNVASGKLMFWSKGETNNPVRVKVNNEEKAISVFSLVTPECDDTGRATFRLPPGKYNWIAWSGKDTVKGTSDVRLSSCTKELVYFPIITADTTITQNKNCVLSSVYFNGPPALNLLNIYNEVDATFAGNTITELLYITEPAPIRLSHPVSKSGDSLFIDRGTAYEKYFVLDQFGRPVYYRGAVDPANMFSSVMIQVHYAYDQEGQMSMRKVQNNYNMTLTETSYVWVNGNISRVIENYPLAGFQKELRFEYYTEKFVNRYPVMWENATELLLFQPVLNLGKSVRNPFKKVYILTTNGEIENEFRDYLIDNNNYVIQVSRTDKFGYRTNFSFGYHCF